MSVHALRERPYPHARLRPRGHGSWAKRNGRAVAGSRHDAEGLAAVGGALADYRKRLKAALSWLLLTAALGPFIVYLLLTLLANLLDDD